MLSEEGAALVGRDRAQPLGELHQQLAIDSANESDEPSSEDGDDEVRPSSPAHAAPAYEAAPPRGGSALS
jgi:hypothetical protein